MNDLTELLRRYSTKHDKKIKDICSPLSKFLGIPHFTYYFIEADGTFGCIANNIEFMEYYYSENIFLHNPYMGHPDLFRSSYAFLPCAFDDNTQKILRKRFLADHLFLMLKKSEGRIFSRH